jgi:hypothetical protein
VKDESQELEKGGHTGEMTWQRVKTMRAEGMELEITAGIGSDWDAGMLAARHR